VATEIRSFAVAVPAGVSSAAPYVQALTMPQRRITNVRVRFPPGPRGNVGFRLTSNRQAVIPPDPTQWIVADNEWFDWPVADSVQPGVWEAVAYNSGLMPHTIQLQVSCEPLTSPAANYGPTIVDVTPA